MDSQQTDRSVARVSLRKWWDTETCPECHGKGEVRDDAVNDPNGYGMCRTCNGNTVI